MAAAVEERYAAAMKVHWLQHAPFEGLGRMDAWLRGRGHSITGTRLYAGEALPPQEAFEWLIVMGGPMNVYEHRNFPHLVPEKEFIKAALEGGKRILGVCLGAQLIADVAGGKVFQNPHREIGWFPIRPVKGTEGSPFALPDEARVFHWHGDTFSLPPGAQWLARSDATAHQAFSIGSRVLGLQFHPEAGAGDVASFVEAGGSELQTTSRYIQSADHILSEAHSAAPALEPLLDRLLRALAAG